MNYLPKIIHQQYFFFLGNHPTASSSAIIIDTTFLPSHNKCIQICKHFNVIRGLISERESNLQNYFTFSTFILASTPQTIWTHLSESPLQAHHRPLCNRHNLHATPTNISHHSIMNQTWTRPTQHPDKPINNKTFIKCKQQREGEIEVRKDTRETRRYRWLTIILRSNTIFSLLCFDLFAFVPHSWSLLRMNAHQPLLWSDHVV